MKRYYSTLFLAVLFSSVHLLSNADVSSPEALALGLRSTGYYLQHGLGSWNKYPFRHRKFYGFGGK